MRRSVENAETVGMRRYHTRRPSPAHPTRDVPTSPIARRARQARFTYDPPARVPIHAPETSRGPFGVALTALGHACCFCPVTRSYLYGVTHCPDCGGRRSTHRINFNRIPTRHLHKLHCCD